MLTLAKMKETTPMAQLRHQLQDNKSNFWPICSMLKMDFFSTNFQRCLIISQVKKQCVNCVAYLTWHYLKFGNSWSQVKCKLFHFLKSILLFKNDFYSSIWLPELSEIVLKGINTKKYVESSKNGNKLLKALLWINFDLILCLLTESNLIVLNIAC